MLFQIQSPGLIVRDSNPHVPNLPVFENLFAAAVGLGHDLFEAKQAGLLQRCAEAAIEPYLAVVGRLES